MLFWALFVFVSLFVFSSYYWAENPFLQYFFILISIVYLNNEILLPYFSHKKWYLLYALVIGLIAFFATQAYCNFFAECGCSIMKCLADYLWQTLVPIVFFSFLWMLYNNLEKQDELTLVRKEKVEMELKFLKSQINPHVLFNNLNTVYSFALEKPKKVAPLILMLSDNLKHVLYESNSEKISIEKEIAYIDNYIAFQQIRTEGTKTIVYTKKTDNETYEIAPLLLITLLENAFKHSTINSIITITVLVDNGILDFYCENKPDQLKEPETRHKIGLENLNKRLSFLYKNKFEMNITTSDTYAVHLKIELQ